MEYYRIDRDGRRISSVLQRMLLTKVLAVNIVCLAMTASSLSSAISSPSKKLLREQQEYHTFGVIASLLNTVPNHVWETAASDLMKRGVATGKSSIIYIA